MFATARQLMRLADDDVSPIMIGLRLPQLNQAADGESQLIRMARAAILGVALQRDHLRQTEGRLAPVALKVGDVPRLIQVVYGRQVDIHRAPAEEGDAGLVDGARVHLALIHDLATHDDALLDDSFGPVALVLEDQIGAIRLGLDLDRAPALQELHILDRDILAADALVLLVLVLDIDLARLARRHPDHGVLQLPQGRRRGVHRTRMAGDDDLVLRLIQAGEGVLHVRHGIVQGGIHRVLVQDMMPVPEDRLALAIEEELAPLSRRDIADAAVDIEGVFLLIRIAALAHPVVPSQVQRQHALFVVAEGFQIGQFGRFTDLAEVRGRPAPRSRSAPAGR